jgi:phage-related protein
MADGRIIIDTDLNTNGVESDINKLGSTIGSVAKTGLKLVTGAVAAAGVAITGLTKLSIGQYGEYEQLVGGVETLFKSSSDEVIGYANNAYKTAGLSANEYMSTITGFSASLLQGLGGDTKKAAQIGNMAVTDMSDNANKMGTAMGDIQNAYQGFAKSNYTMLDNLKLGRRAIA